MPEVALIMVILAGLFTTLTPNRVNGALGWVVAAMWIAMYIWR